jgi:hypothetical protein
MTNTPLSNATEQCYRADAQAKRLVRPRTDGRNGLTKRGVYVRDLSCVSNARETGDPEVDHGDPRTTDRSAAALMVPCETCQAPHEYGEPCGYCGATS